MHIKSLLTRNLHRLALFGLVAAFVAANATAQSVPFINVSSRAQVLNGDNVIILGFTISGTSTVTKKVLIRGLGPSTGLSGYLADPTITLNGPSGVIYTNNNWKDTQQTEIQNLGWQPGNDLESAMVQTLAPGSYTVVMSGNNGATGVGVLEIWDFGGPAAIVGASTRALVGTGDNALIAGLYVKDGTRAVIRAIGPTLANYGIQGALQNPSLELYNSSGTQIAANDDWGSNPQTTKDEIQRIGLQPSNTSESEILPTLTAGSYTAIVRGVNNTSGVATVEAYALEEYPKIFQNWANATNPSNPSEDPMFTVARHDLFWTSLNGFGLYWETNGNPYDGDYRSETLTYTGAQAYDLPTIRAYNPKIKILGQIQHYSARLDGDERLPADSPWWKRQNGQLVPAPIDPGRYLLDQDNPDLRAHVANQAKALMDSGRVDGIMLDSCDINTSYLNNLLSDIRAQIGETALIIVNVNSKKLSSTELSKINGVFMECGKVGTGGAYPTWATVRGALDWNETYTHYPKVNCLQDWYSTDPENTTDLQRMRAITALALTHSNGLVNFGYDVYHWYDPFWSDHSLGVPLGTWYQYGSAHRRDFHNGTAVYNEAGNGTVTVTFPQLRRNRSTNTWGTTFTVPGGDGGIFTFY